MISLPLETIINDMNRFCGPIRERLDADAVTVFCQPVSDSPERYSFGYVFEMGPDRYVAYMTYQKNDREEFEKIDDSWTVTYDHAIVGNAQTLGEVFRLITSEYFHV